MKNEKRQRNTMQKEQRKKESKGDNERMLNLKEVILIRSKVSRRSFRTKTLSS